MKQNNSINNDGNQSQLEAGLLLHDTYCILSELSKGGFGDVYLALHVHLRSLCAIKVIKPDSPTGEINMPSTTRPIITGSLPTDGKYSIDMLSYGAKCLHLVCNSHVVRFYDLFEEDGAYYFVMEYVEGESLKEKSEKQNGKLNEKEVEKILRQLLIALKAIHAYGVIHLDIKPSNIIMSPKGMIKLIDFGSCYQSTVAGVKTVTLPLAYNATYTDGFSPIEQMEMQNEKIGPWTDFYALGATLFNLLTGQLPPKTSDLIDNETSNRVFHGLYNVSPRMRDLIQWLMQPNWRNRPKNVTEIINFLKDWKILRNEEALDAQKCWQVPLPTGYILHGQSIKYRIIATLSTDLDTITYIANAIAEDSKTEGHYYLIGERFEYRFSRRSSNGTVFDIDPMSTRIMPSFFYKTAEEKTKIKEASGQIIKKGITKAERFNTNGTSYYAIHLKMDI